MGKTISGLEMAKRCVMFTFSPEVITEPIIYNLGQQFRLITNIRRADLTEERSWIALELERKEEDIEAGIAQATFKGVRVDLVTGDIEGG